MYRLRGRMCDVTTGGLEDNDSPIMPMALQWGMLDDSLQ
jgi:hypothetical protein